MTERGTRKGIVEHPVVRHRDCWNKCDVCGRFIPFDDLEGGKAIHNMKTPDSDVSYETWETLCRDHFKANAKVVAPPSEGYEPDSVDPFWEPEEDFYRRGAEENGRTMI